MKGVIFDSDGVLLDSMKIWGELAIGFLAKRGITAEDGLRETVFPMSIMEAVLYLKKQYNLPESPEEIIKEVQIVLFDFYHNRVTLKDGVMDLLIKISEKNIPIVVLTSSPRGLVEKAFERLGVTPYLTNALYTDEIGESKHTQTPYLKAVEVFGAKPEECLVIEDSLFALKNASEAGCKTIGVFDAEGESNQEGLKECADYYVKSMREIVGLIDKICI